MSSLIGRSRKAPHQFPSDTSTSEQNDGKDVRKNQEKQYLELRHFNKRERDFSFPDYQDRLHQEVARQHLRQEETREDQLQVERPRYLDQKPDFRNEKSQNERKIARKFSLDPRENEIFAGPVPASGGGTPHAVRTRGYTLDIREFWSFRSCVVSVINRARILQFSHTGL